MTFNIGKPSDGVTDGQRIQRLYLYLNQMADKLNYALNNMDEQNLTRTFLASLTNGGDSDQQPDEEDDQQPDEEDDQHPDEEDEDLG